MKLYKGFKRMKNTTKIGLATSAVYTASALAIPAFANTVEQPVFQPVDVKQITTVEQAENIYNTKLAEYAQDKKITSDEVTELAKIESRKYSLLEKQTDILGKEKYKLDEQALALDKEIDTNKGKLANLDNQLQHPNVKKSLEGNLDQFEKNVLVYYPGLINKGNRAISYSAETQIKPLLKPIFYKIVEDTHKVLEDNYSDECMSSFLNSSLTIGDVIAFYEILTNKIATIKDDGKIDDKTLMQEKQDIGNKVKNLESEKSLIVNSEHMKQLESKIEQLHRKMVQISDSYKPLREYLERCNEINSFTATHEKDLSRYYSLSVMDLGQYYGAKSSSYNYRSLRGSLGNSKGFVSNLESYFQNQGFDVKIVDKLRNPAKPRWPLWTIPLTLAAPIFRNMLVIKYLGGGKQTGDDYVMGGVLLGGFMENVLFFCFLDSVHPLVYPVRMIGLPFVWHGLLKITGGDKGLYDYAK